MKMKTDALFFIAGVLAIIESVTTGFETVWLRDMTEQVQADKRALGEYDLPYQLTFYLKRGSDDLTLNLVRNYDIDPNAEFYVVQELSNGRSFLARTNDKEKEDVAYYQDVQNMAFVIVRCVARSNHKCDRIINGNVRIGDYNYDLRPVESDFASGLMSEIPSVIGKRYLILDHADVDNKDAANIRAANIEEEVFAGLRRFRGREKQNHFRLLNGSTRQQSHKYYVKVAVLVDSGVYDLYDSIVQSADPFRKSEIVRERIREAYSHIINGVNLRFKTIDDPSISITVILQHFTVFQREALFPHKSSKVVTENEKKYIAAHIYARDLKQWVQKYGIHMVPEFDHAMLFTGYELYRSSTDDNSISGVSFIGGVCDVVEGVSLVQSKHYSRTVLTATHELGHNLGAHHDGTAEAKYCHPDEKFIMYRGTIKFNETTPYSRNEWIFSNCSVESFKKTLIFKECAKYPGVEYDTDEWMMFMMRQAGDVFTPNMQCYIIYGPHHVHYGVVDENICQRLRCRNLKTRQILRRYLYAAEGTKCGKNMWCIEGICVSKRSK